MNKWEFRQQFVKMADNIWAWRKTLPAVSVLDVISDAESSRHTYVFSADMIKGFCKKGNLASPRVDALSMPIADLFTKLREVGVSNFVLVQEWHDAHAKEFSAFPPHCVRETEESKTIPELVELPFAREFVIFRKNALSPAWSYREKQHEPPPHTHPIYPKGFTPVFRESFEHYIETRDIDTAIVVGNCTDLCVRELAMFLKMWANEHQKDMRVIIPANCVETFDLPLDVAQKIGAMPHPADIYHVWALHEMARNGIEVVREIG